MIRSVVAVERRYGRNALRRDGISIEALNTRDVFRVRRSSRRACQTTTRVTILMYLLPEPISFCLEPGSEGEPFELFIVPKLSIS